MARVNEFNRFDNIAKIKAVLDGSRPNASSKSDKVRTVNSTVGGR